MSRISAKNYADALTRLADEGLPTLALTQAADAVADSLLASGRGAELVALVQHLEKSDGRSADTPEFMVESAQALSSAQKKRITSVQAVDGERTDPSLLAGVRLRIGDQLIRSSARDRLEKVLYPNPFH